MKIVIAGAGAIGFHLAKLLSHEDQDITLIDSDDKVLHHVSRHLDVMTIVGDCLTPSILEQTDLKSVKLFIAVTTSEKTNLLACILAKQFGATKTIARVSNGEFFLAENKKRFVELGIDTLISPKMLGSKEIYRLLNQSSFTDLFEFEEGKISVVGFTIEEGNSFANQTITELHQSCSEFPFRAIAILRGHETIIPNSDTIVKAGDHLYISSKSNHLQQLRKMISKQNRPIKKIMILGGTPIALSSAKMLESQYSLTVVIADENVAKIFHDRLDNTLVINTDPGDIDSLKEEGLESMDAVVALTPNSETNIVSCLMSKDLGVEKTIAMVENVDYTHISQNIGIDTIINKKLIAANSIFRHVRKGKIQAIASLHGVDAEIIEFEVHKRNRVTNHSIKELRFPKQSVIVGIVRGEESFVPKGEDKFEYQDKVIVFAMPEAIHQIEEIFK